MIVHSGRLHGTRHVPYSAAWDASLPTHKTPHPLFWHLRFIICPGLGSVVVLYTSSELVFAEFSGTPITPPDTTAMAPPGRRKTEWEQWFHRCLLLPNSGFVPSDPGSKHISPPSEVVTRWGEKQGAGYIFLECDGEEYYLYVCELFQRVHQRRMMNRTLPLHFARGLLEESKGNPVDWTAFAMLRCFPAQRKRPFHPWGPYEHVRRPLPWLHPKCLPAGGRRLNGGMHHSDSAVSNYSLPCLRSYD